MAGRDASVQSFCAAQECGRNGNKDHRYYPDTAFQPTFARLEAVNDSV